MKTFKAPGSHYRIQETLESIFQEHPKAVVLDGDDNWYANDAYRPSSYPRIFSITPLASFHSGISGMAVTGIVVSQEDFWKIEREFPTKTFTQLDGPSKTGLHLKDCVKVYKAR